MSRHAQRIDALVLLADTTECAKPDGSGFDCPNEEYSGPPGTCARCAAILELQGALEELRGERPSHVEPRSREAEVEGRRGE